MKQALLFVMLICGISNAQVITFADTNFQAKLLAANSANNIAYGPTGWGKIDTNNNGQIEIPEAAVITRLNVSFEQNSGVGKFSSIVGIEHFSGLQVLYCNNNLMSSIELTGILPNLTSLTLDGNPLTNLDCSNRPSLTFLWTQGCPIVSVNLAGCLNLDRLNMWNNELTFVDLSGLTLLTNINLAQNNITSIDLSDQIIMNHLTIGSNQLNGLDLSNNTNLTYLEFRNNVFNTIDLSNNTALTYLDCLYGTLTSIDVSMLPNLTKLRIGGSQLQTINMKNGNIDDLEMPHCPSLIYICTDDSELADVIGVCETAQNLIPVTSYCDFAPGGDHNTISGVIRYDADGNGCDADDVVVPHVSIGISDGTTTGLAFSNQDGNYIAYAQQPTLTLTAQPYDHFNVSPATTSIDFPVPNGTTINQDYCLTPIGIHSEVEVMIAPQGQPRPGFDYHLTIVYTNTGNQIENGAISFDYDDDLMDLLIGSQVPNVSSTGYLEYNYGSLLPFETRVIELVFNINSPTDAPAVNIDDILTYNSAITTAGSDPADEMTFKPIVVGSFDPNDKHCMEGAIVSPQMIGEYLHYIINFENTGNFPAENVVVVDDLDAVKYDLSSLKILHTSHPSQVRLTGNRLEFIHQGIDLGPQEHGYVVFMIKSKPTLITGDSVSNNANIFFDFNFPVETNVATTTFQELSVVGSDLIKVSVFPNPTSGSVNFTGTDILSVTLYDINGRLLMTKNASDGNIVIDLTDRQLGFYFAKVVTSQGDKTFKLIRN